MSSEQIVVSKAVDTISQSSILRLTSGIQVGTNDFVAVLSYANSFFAGQPVFASPRLTSGPYAGQRRVVLAVANNRWEIYLSDMTNLNTRVFNFYSGDTGVMNPLLTTWRPLSDDGVEPFPKIELIAPTVEHSVTLVQNSKYSDTCQAQIQDQVFAMLGDWGSGDSNQANVVGMVNSWSPDFVVTTGDNVHGLSSSMSINQAETAFTNTVSTAFSALTTTNRFFPAIGNRDTDLGVIATNIFSDDGTLETFGAKWFRDKLPSVFKGNKNYYRVRPYNGYTEFFVLSSGWGTGSTGDSRMMFEPDGNTIGSVQYNWLERALKDSDALYKIVVLHHPPFTNSQTNSPGFHAVRWNFAEMGASAVIAGHSQNYERFLNQTIPYLVIGHGGATLQQYTKSASDSVSIIDNPPRFGALRCVANASSLLIENRIHTSLTSSIVQDSFRIYPNQSVSTKNETYSSTADKSQSDSAFRVNVWNRAKRFNDFGQLIPSGIREVRINTIAAGSTSVQGINLGKIGNPSNMVVEFAPLKQIYDNGGTMDTLRYQIRGGIFPPELRRVDTLYHNDLVGSVPNYLRFYVTTNASDTRMSRMSGYSAPTDAGGGVNDHFYSGYRLERLNYFGYQFTYSANGISAGHYGPYKAGVLGCTNARVVLASMGLSNDFTNGTILFLILINRSSTAWVPTSSNDEAWAVMYWT